MLKSKVGYSINADSFTAAEESIKKSINGLSNPTFSFLFTSCKNDIKQVVKGIRNVTDTNFIGCTSNDGIIVPDGIIRSENGFIGTLTLSDEKMNVGVACHEAGHNAREIGKKVAIMAVQNAKTTRAPAYFYMIASPKEEEDYLMGIQDVIGRVPMFGGSAADDLHNNNWKIICNDQIIDDGVAVAFFYTDNEIETKFTGAYNETDNVGVITEVEEDRIISKIDNVGALKKYANWVNMSPLSLKGDNLYAASITKPLGIKDPIGNITLIKPPIYGEDMGTRTTLDDKIILGNKVANKTSVIQLESTIDEMINSSKKTISQLKSKLYTEPAAYILLQNAGRRVVIGPRLEEVYADILSETKDIPFIMAFTYGEYGYDDHSANYCGGLMLSFTIFGKK